MSHLHRISARKLAAMLVATAVAGVMMIGIAGPAHAADVGLVTPGAFCKDSQVYDIGHTTKGTRMECLPPRNPRYRWRAAPAPVKPAPIKAKPFVAPRITTPSIVSALVGSAVTVRGTAGAGAVVVLHFHRQGTPAADYSIVRTVQASASGVWFRTFILSTGYRIFATVGVGHPHSQTVLFQALPEPVLGTVQDVLGANGSTTLGVQFAAIDGNAVSSDGFEVPAAGNRYVAVSACVRNRGPAAFSDAADNDFKLGDAANQTYEPNFVTVTDAPDLDLTNMITGELRCGAVTFEVPITANVSTLRFTPDSGFGATTLRWETP